MTATARFMNRFRAVADGPSPLSRVGETDDGAASASDDRDAAPAQEGMIDAQQRVGHPGAESSATRQEPASIPRRASIAKGRITAASRACMTRIHAQARRHRALDTTIEMLRAGKAKCETALEGVPSGRHTFWGRYHLFLIALVGGAGGALEVTMNNLALQWLELPDEQEYRLVAVVVSIAVALGAIAVAIVNRSENGGGEVPHRVRLGLAGLIALLVFAIEILHGVPGVIQHHDNARTPLFAFVAMACLAILAGLPAAGIRRWPLLSIAGVALIGGGLIALTELRADPKLMPNATGAEVVYGTIALGAAAVAATLFVYVLTHKLLGLHAEDSAATRLEQIERRLEGWGDLLVEAEVLKAGYPQMIEELFDDGRGEIGEIQHGFAAEAWEYAQGSQRQLAEAAPDVAALIARLESEIGTVAVDAAADIQRAAKDALENGDAPASTNGRH